MTDQLTPYETGLNRLRDGLPSDHPSRSEFNTLEGRLRENIAAARTHGDTETLRHERSRIVEALNPMAQTTFGVPFIDLCPGLPPHRPSPVETYLSAVRYYCADLPYLTLYDTRSPETLAELYIPLRARLHQRQDEELRAGRGQPLSIDAMLRDGPHVLILGEPGAGKSTLLRHLAENAWEEPERVGLDGPHLPLLVSLRRLAAVEASLETRAWPRRWPANSR